MFKMHIQSQLVYRTHSEMEQRGTSGDIAKRDNHEMNGRKM